MIYIYDGRCSLARKTQRIFISNSLQSERKTIVVTVFLFGYESNKTVTPRVYFFQIERN